MSHPCQNRVYHINSEIGIDIGVTAFTVHPGDTIIFGESQVEEIIYKSPKWPDQMSESEYHLLKLHHKPRVSWMGYFKSWCDFTHIIKGGGMTDITTEYKRDKLIESII